jgi:hypothetical protein
MGVTVGGRVRELTVLAQLVGALCLLVGLTGPAGAQSWDAFVKVPAVAATPGVWLACPPGSNFPFASPGASVEPRCVIRKMLREETVQAATAMTLQQVLEMYVHVPVGFRALAVGPMPVLLEQMTMNSVDPTFIYIAYRLVAKS